MSAEAAGSGGRRISNRTADERCSNCDDEGVFIVGTETRGGSEYDQAGPCPLCENGFRTEYGIGRDKDGREKRSARPPWGPDGYWHGRPFPTAG